MSHNNLKIGSALPDASSSIAVNVEDLNDVSVTSPSENQVLRYLNGTWSNTNLPFESIFIGEGASQDYSTSSASSTSSGAVVEFYDSSLINTITDASVSQTSDWVQSITLGVGEYVVSAVIGLTFSSSSGQALFRIYQDASAVGSQGIVGYDSQDVGSRAEARISITSGTATISVMLTSSTSANSVVSQGNRHAERSFLEVRRI